MALPAEGAADYQNSTENGEEYGTMSEYTGPCVRLEQYMAAEYDGERGWSVERCYMLREDYDRVMTLPERGRERGR